MTAKDYKQTIAAAVDRLPDREIDRVIEIVWQAYLARRRIFLIGNGGSAANASHFAQDLVRNTCLGPDQTNRIRALSLCDNVASITGAANDDGYETVFAEQLKTHAEAGDLLIAISGSGNSPNIIRAAEWAKANRVTVLAITAFDGGKLRLLADECLWVELEDMGAAESIHALVFHYVVQELRQRMKEAALAWIADKS